jgi:hypothetical protein
MMEQEFDHDQKDQGHEHGSKCMRRSRPIDFCGFPTLTERRVSF